MSLLSTNRPLNPLTAMYNSFVEHMENRIMQTGRNKALGSPGHYNQADQATFFQLLAERQRYNTDPVFKQSVGMSADEVDQIVANAAARAGKAHGIGITDHAKGLFMTDQGVYSPFTAGGAILGGIYMGGAIANRM